MPPTSTTPLAMKRVSFAPYNVDEKAPQKKASATAFAIIRRALLQSAGKPTNIELPGAWRIAAELQMVFSDMEHKHEESAGMMPDERSPSGFREIKMPVIVLNPAGVSVVLSEQHVHQLRTIFDEWVKSKGTNAEAMSIHLAYQWFADPDAIQDASKESAVASGAVAAPGTHTPAPEAEQPAPAASDVGVAN